MNPDSNNPYEVLGLKPGATREEVDKKFKELSKRNHPDKHGGDPYYTKLFAKISAARDSIIANIDGTQDNARPFGTQRPGFGFANFTDDDIDINDFMKQFFGEDHPFKRERSRHEERTRNKVGRDQLVPIRIPLIVMMTGGKVNVKYQRARCCSSCSGSGHGHSMPCRFCNGTGRLPIQHEFQRGLNRCPACSGSGSLKEDCRPCRGRGFYPEDNVVVVDIPADIYIMQNLQIDGYGNEYEPNRFGALILQVQPNTDDDDESPNNIRIRDNEYNIEMSFNISMLDVMFRNKVELDLPSGTRIRLEIGPEHTKYSGSPIRVKSEGLRTGRNSDRTSIYLKPVIYVPDNIYVDGTNEEIEMLKQLKNVFMVPESEE